MNEDEVQFGEVNGGGVKGYKIVLRVSKDYTYVIQLVRREDYTYVIQPVRREDYIYVEMRHVIHIEMRHFINLIKFNLDKMSHFKILYICYITCTESFKHCRSMIEHYGCLLKSL